MHPVYERLLDRFCEEIGFDARKIREMMAGARPTPEQIVDMMNQALDVPRSAWPKRARPLVSRDVSRQDTPVTPGQRQQILRANSRSRRKYKTPVHAVLDRLGWTIEEFAQAVSAARGGKPISRPSMQFWATGTRQVGPKGASRSHATQAPLDVRQVAEVVTRQKAKELGLDEAEAVLRVNDWPNVEPQ